jgi:hypothetical protein
MTRAPVPDASCPDELRHARVVEAEHRRALGDTFLLTDAAARAQAEAAAAHFAVWRQLAAAVGALTPRRGRSRGSSTARLRRREARAWQQYVSAIAKVADLAGRHEVRPSRRWSRFPAPLIGNQAEIVGQTARVMRRHARVILVEEEAEAAR